MPRFPPLNKISTEFWVLPNFIRKTERQTSTIISRYLQQVREMNVYRRSVPSVGPHDYIRERLYGFRWNLVPTYATGMHSWMVLVHLMVQCYVRAFYWFFCIDYIDSYQIYIFWGEMLFCFDHSCYSSHICYLNSSSRILFCDVSDIRVIFEFYINLISFVFILVLYRGQWEMATRSRARTVDRWFELRLRHGCLSLIPLCCVAVCR